MDRGLIPPFPKGDENSRFSLGMKGERTKRSGTSIGESILFLLCWRRLGGAGVEERGGVTQPDAIHDVGDSGRLTGGVRGGVRSCGGSDDGKAQAAFVGLFAGTTDVVFGGKLQDKRLICWFHCCI